MAVGRDILKNLNRHKDEDLLKSQAVKNQRSLWHKVLEFRFSLQKSFPCRLLGLTKTCHAVSCRMATFRNKSIEEWQRKTEVTTGATAIKANCMLLIRILVNKLLLI
ncbi:uncharacterized protein [Pyrus communis]|uniref:uncharacterized protein isoform X1 n=1 Tax=Pyrus communis TaxID=23211 RepID=UPI0035BFD55A